MSFFVNLLHTRITCCVRQIGPGSFIYRPTELKLFLITIPLIFLSSLTDFAFIFSPRRFCVQ